MRTASRSALATNCSDEPSGPDERYTKDTAHKLIEEANLFIDAAHKAQVGFAVGPVRQRGYLGPISELPIVAIRADPATVEPSGKPGDAPAADRLRGSHLLYLGQSGGTVVLYDPAFQQAVYVPAASIILRVLNCDGGFASELPDCRFSRS